MENNNKNKYRFLVIVLSILLAIALALLSVVYNDNKNLEDQVLKRQKLINKTIVNDKILSKQKTKSDSIIEHYIDDCGIMINNKKVSTDELLDFLHSQSQEINTLNSSNQNLNDSLRIYRGYIDLSKRNFDVKYSVKKDNNQFVTSISLPGDSLKIYKRIYDLIKRDYGIIYKMESKNDKTILSKNFTKLDSALFLYKHYKHVLGGDSLGNVTILIPTEKEIKKANKRKSNK